MYLQNEVRLGPTCQVEQFYLIYSLSKWIDFSDDRQKLPRNIGLIYLFRLMLVFRLTYPW